MCPQLYGLNVIKQALAMVLAGGVQDISYLTGGNHRESVSTGVWTVCCQAGCCISKSRWCSGKNISDRL